MADAQPTPDHYLAGDPEAGDLEARVLEIEQYLAEPDPAPSVSVTGVIIHTPFGSFPVAQDFMRDFRLETTLGAVIVILLVALFVFRRRNAPAPK